MDIFKRQLSTTFLFTFLLLLMHPDDGSAQIDNYDYAYRSRENKLYWKNSPPYPGYWQQDVAYEIKARIEDSTDILYGDYYKLTYYNNSPNTLHELYFHLYSNAFQPGSHYHELWMQNDQKPTFGKYEQQKLGLETENIKVNGQPVDTAIDNTIIQVTLNEPLLPGDSAVITMTFKNYFDDGGSMRRRMKVYSHDSVKHYDGVHWYPSIAVYDRNFSWTTDQHLDKEFYANFGSFDIELTFPQEYIVDATGLLQNESEVLPADLRQKIDLSNFSDKEWESPPSIIVPRVKGKTKTWKFKALNVHNFAFTADPTYRMMDIDLPYTKVRALAQEGHASKWQQTAPFTAAIIELYSRDFGKYEWPKIIAADANDGMEYPMLTLDGGSYPGHQGLIAHEVGHMWFYGMLGSNETYRAFMDEGFTQFLTAWSMDKLTGNRPFLGNMPYSRFARSHYPYVNTVVEGFDHKLNTHSSDFRGAIRQGGGYGLVYTKASSMLYALNYVLGDSLFLGAIQHYVNTWKICHPYPEDFRKTITDFVQTDLNWFFDQWLETTKTLDYGIEKVKQKGDSLSITLKREGEMEMPIDLDIYLENGDTLRYHVPNTWFKKPTDRTILPKWYQMSILHPTYTFTIPVEANAEKVILDPEAYLADVYPLNNEWKRPIALHFDTYQPAPSYDWAVLHNYVRPALWYNSYDGLKIGAKLRGSYWQNDHAYELTTYWNSGIGQSFAQNPEISESQENRLEDEFQRFSYLFEFEKGLWKRSAGLSAHMRSAWDVGLFRNQVWLEKIIRKQDSRNPTFTSLSAGYKSLYRNATDPGSYFYLLYPSYWGESHNSTGYLSFRIHREKDKRISDLSGTLRVPAFTSYSYSYVELAYSERRELWNNKIVMKNRLFNRTGSQVSNQELPFESLLYLSGGSPEAMMENPFTQARGWIPPSDYGYRTSGAPFHYAGGLNLRGFANVAPAPGLTEGGLNSEYGFSGYAANTEIEFQNLSPWKLRQFKDVLAFRAYFFGDVGGFYRGISVFEDIYEGNYLLYSDAGLGSTLEIKFGRRQIQPITLRFDVPLYLNREYDAAENRENLRWIFGVNSLF